MSSEFTYQEQCFQRLMPNTSVFSSAFVSYAITCHQITGEPDDKIIAPVVSSNHGVAFNGIIRTAAHIVGFMLDLLPTTHPADSPERFEIYPHAEQMVQYILGDSPDLQFSADAERLRHQDQHFPFRESAPSRSAVRTQFTTPLMITRSGLFSALVFRGITFGTTFPLRPSNMFRDWSDFNMQVQEERQIRQAQSPDLSAADLEDRHICTMKAYGVPNYQRKVELAKELWEKSKAWEGFMATHTVPVAWEELSSWIQQTKLPLMQERSSLTRYLLMLDLAYAGVTEFPTDVEVGNAVQHLGRGAKNGLVLLGAIPADAPHSAVAEAFTQVWTLVDRTWKALAAEQATGGQIARPSDMEHILCKIGRVNRKGQYAIDTEYVQEIAAFICDS